MVGRRRQPSSAASTSWSTARAPSRAAGRRPTLAEITDDAICAEVETKVLGYLRCARAVAPHMIAQGWGRIINISGLAARQTGSIVGSIRNVAVAAHDQEPGRRARPARHQRHRRPPRHDRHRADAGDARRPRPSAQGISRGRGRGGAGAAASASAGWSRRRRSPTWSRSWPRRAASPSTATRSPPAAGRRARSTTDRRRRTPAPSGLPRSHGWSTARRPTHASSCRRR